MIARLGPKRLPKSLLPIRCPKPPVDQRRTPGPPIPKNPINPQHIKLSPMISIHKAIENFQSFLR